MIQGQLRLLGIILFIERKKKMSIEKKKRALKLMEMALNHSEYETSERIRKEAEKWFNESIKLEKKKL